MLNSIYNQALYVQRKDVKDFLSYARLWCRVVATHHKNEEGLLFPWIERSAGVAGLMDGNREQHTVFQGGLEALENYLNRCEKKEEIFNGATMVLIIGDLGETARALGR